MATTAHRWAPVLGLAVAWAAAAEARPARSGKVVRIERPRLTSVKRLQICQVATPIGGAAGQQSFCIGPKPDDGADGVWFNIQTEEVIGRVRVDNPAPHPQDTCGLGQWHLVDTTMVASGPGAVPTQAYTANLVILNLEVEPGAHMRWGRGSPAPSGNSNETVIGEIDRDGDGENDMLITDRECEAEYPPPASVAGRVYTTRCYAFWALDGVDWHRVHEDVLHQCQ
jgi:hypothetical protein